MFSPRVVLHEPQVHAMIELAEQRQSAPENGGLHQEVILVDQVELGQGLHTASSKRVPADRIVNELTRRGINTVLTLREYGILDFDAKGVSAAIRVSPHYYNTELEIETFLGAMEEILAAC